VPALSIDITSQQAYGVTGRLDYFKEFLVTLDFTSELTSSSFCAKMFCVSAVTARHLYLEMLINRLVVETKGKTLSTD